MLRSKFTTKTMAGQRQLVLFSVLLAAALLAGMAECELGDQCGEFVYGGLIYPEGRPPSVEHGLHWSKTQSKPPNPNPASHVRMRGFLYCTRGVVGKPAPDWNGTAVLNGHFLELRLADFKGRVFQITHW